MTSFRQFLLWGGALLAASAFTGCATRGPAIDDELHAGPFYAPTNFARVPALPADLRRVILLPVSGVSVVPEETLRSLDTVLLASLTRAQRFELVALSRQDCLALFGRTEFASTDALPADLFERLSRNYGVGAVLLVDVTVYQPYQPQALGLRAKLAGVRDGTVLWSFDELLSTADTAVRNSARRRYFQREHGMRPFDLSPAGLQSPSWFAAFVADEMAATLPPR